MKRYLPFLCLWFTITTATHAEPQSQTRYVTDQLFVALYSDKDESSAIVNKGVASGTAVKVLEEDKTSGFTHVEIPNGQTGWIPSRQLINTAIAREQLQKLQKQYDELAQGGNSNQKNTAKLQGDNTKLTNDIARLERENAALQAQVGSIQELPMDPVRMRENSEKLVKDNELLLHKIDVLQNEIDRLRSDEKWRLARWGIMLVILGALIPVLVTWLKPRPNTGGWA